MYNCDHIMCFFYYAISRQPISLHNSIFLLGDNRQELEHFVELTLGCRPGNKNQTRLPLLYPLTQILPCLQTSWQSVFRSALTCQLMISGTI